MILMSTFVPQNRAFPTDKIISRLFCTFLLNMASYYRITKASYFCHPEKSIRELIWLQKKLRITIQTKNPLVRNKETCLPFLMTEVGCRGQFSLSTPFFRHVMLTSGGKYIRKRKNYLFIFCTSLIFVVPRKLILN